MLVKITVSQLRLGMFVHAVEGGWMASPFWRSRFILSRQSDLDKLIAAGIEKVVIDDSRGLGLTPAPKSTLVPVIQPPAATTQEPAPVAGENRMRRRLVTELERARDTVERSKVAVTHMFEEARLGHAIDTSAIAPLVDEIAASVKRDSSAMVSVSRLKNKDEYTYMHSVAVCALMINLARRLALPEEDIRDIGMAGMLHDIGKMAVPRAVLEKPGALDAAEAVMVRSHPVQGHRQLIETGDFSPIVLEVCLHHHERIDGRGYPLGLQGDALGFYARMGAICDVYDAVTSNRSYKRAWSPSDALAQMLEWDGHFDPGLLAIFIDSIGIQPLGALVRLRSNRLAVVIAGNDVDPTAPLVRAFYDIPMQSVVVPVDVAATTSGGDPIMRSERGAYWFGDDWPDMLAAIRTGAPFPATFADQRCAAGV